VYHLKRGGIPVSYAEIFSMNLCIQTLPVEILIPHLADYVKSAEKKEPAGGKKRKILISGSFVSNISLMTFIEERGGDIVADDTCVGLRLLRNIKTEGDPLESVAGYYISGPLCASRADFPSRKAYFQKTLADYDIDAVVFIHQKFCDPHLSDHPFLKRMLDETGIPHFQFELEGEGFTGQVRTRIESFFEMLERR